MRLNSLMYALKCHHGIGWCAYIQCTIDYHTRRVNLNKHMALHWKSFDTTITFNRYIYVTMLLQFFSKKN